MPKTDDTHRYDRALDELRRMRAEEAFRAMISQADRIHLRQRHALGLAIQCLESGRKRTLAPDDTLARTVLDKLTGLRVLNADWMRFAQNAGEDTTRWEDIERGLREAVLCVNAAHKIKPPHVEIKPMPLQFEFGTLDPDGEQDTFSALITLSQLRAENTRKRDTAVREGHDTSYFQEIERDLREAMRCLEAEIDEEPPAGSVQWRRGDLGGALRALQVEMLRDIERGIRRVANGVRRVQRWMSRGINERVRELLEAHGGCTHERD